MTPSDTLYKPFDTILSAKAGIIFKKELSDLFHHYKPTGRAI